MNKLFHCRRPAFVTSVVAAVLLAVTGCKPEDFVIATGVQHAVREFTYAAFKAAGIELKFEGEGLDEKGICVAGPDNLVLISARSGEPVVFYAGACFSKQSQSGHYPGDAKFWERTAGSVSWENLGEIYK